MEVCAFDRAQVAQSYVRKRRVPVEMILIVRNSTPLASDFSSHSMRNTAPYTAECARYAADWFSIVDCMAVNLTLKSRTMLLAFMYIMPLLVNNLVETALI